MRFFRASSSAFLALAPNEDKKLLPLVEAAANLGSARLPDDVLVFVGEVVELDGVNPELDVGGLNPVAVGAEGVNPEGEAVGLKTAEPLDWLDSVL